MALAAGCYVVGYLVGLVAFMVMARRRRMATEGIMMLMFAGLIGGLVFANLGQWAFGGSAGKTVLGALVGGYLCVFLAKKYLGITRPTGDLFAVALCAGEAVGRWGCYFGGCCYGKATDVSWAVWQHGAYRHPTQLYLSLAALLILLILWRFELTSPPENSLFYLQGLLYCAARFGIEFWRVHLTPVPFLSAAQWACLAGILFFGIALIRLLAPARSIRQAPA